MLRLPQTVGSPYEPPRTMALAATEGCLVLHTAKRDSMSGRMNSMHRALNRTYSAEASAVSASPRNVTDESCSDRSMSDPDAGNNTGGSFQKLTRKRSIIRCSNPSVSGLAEGASQVLLEETEYESTTPECEGLCSAACETCEIDVILTGQRNNRVLLRRLEEISSRGRLSMVGLSN